MTVFHSPLANASSLSGILPIIKPSGMISKNVSRWIQKHIDRNVRLGHVGTLDPMAEGVLPIVLGWATRLQDYLLDLPKAYRFTVKFGEETNTLDANGEIVASCDTRSFTAEQITQILPEFVGEITQIPPLYSAVKLDGKELYKYAQKGKSPDLTGKARCVHIYDLKLCDVDNLGQATFLVRCSKGTYVRVLAKDIAIRLGSLGTVTRLLRTEAAGICLDQCVPFSEMESANQINPAWLIEPQNTHLPLKKWMSSSDMAKRLKQGQKLLVEADHFAKCVKYDLRQTPNAQYKAGELLLIDGGGSIFGIGRFIPQDDGRYELSLRRGFVQ